MRHIGDIIKELNIPITPLGGNGGDTSPTYNCPICKDAGFVRIDVPVGHPQFGRAKPCSCRLGVENDQYVRRLISVSNLQMMTELSFANFDAEVPGVEEAYRAARRFATAPDGWLLFKGPIGSGKTHLAIATALEYIERFQQPALFAVVPDLLDHLRAAFDPATGVGYDERFDQIRTTPLLVLDDLGTENATPWAREKLYQIFNYRYNENLPIIVTTNAELRPGGRSATSGIVDERIRSRLLDERTVFAELDAEDYRLRKRANQFRQLKR